MITPAFSLTAIERVLPRLALDFTTAILDPRITFTRTAATATRVNASGVIEVMAADTPRFDFDPVSLACRGLLVEEARTNLVERSEEFENAYWTKTNATVTLNAAIAPNGLLTADKLVEGTATNALVHVQRVVSSSAIAYTWSVYAKAAERNWLVLNVFSLSSSRAYFDLQTGTLGSVAAGITAQITPVNDGWYRCSITRTTPADVNAQWQVGITTANNTPTYTGNGSSGVFIWGAQLEAGAFPTSYIPTTTTSLTRNADVVTMTGMNFSDWYNVGAGSWYIQTNARNAATILTAGTFTLAATATALKKYANSYASDQSATSLVLGQGTVAKVAYYKQAFLAAELAALTN